MKRALFVLVAATASLASAPALTQAAPPPAPATNYTPSPGGGSPYPADQFRIDRQNFGRCFDGRQVVGVNRSGETLYVQAVSGATRANARTGAWVYRMQLPESCAALSQAEDFAVRSNNDLVCEGSSARIEFRTTDGVKTCKVSKVRALNRTEVAQLAGPAKP